MMVDVEDLLIEILVRLPPICLPRFQLVSKKWFSIISTRLPSHRLPADVTGFFCAHPDRTPPFPGPLFVSLKGPDENPQHTHQLSYRLKELCGGGPIVSLHSCNGLLCVWCLDENGSNSFYVFNPTTNQRRHIPHPFSLSNKMYVVRAMNIAFDPSKSHHYKLVCIYKYRRNRPEKLEFSVFSSESRVWRKSDEQLTFKVYPCDKPGAFLNGAIHWYTYLGDLFCFDVDNARLRPMPPSPFNHLERCLYFGESGGHLRFIEQCVGHGRKLLNVLEMENDYSRWVFKYQVDLTAMKTRFFPSGFPAVEPNRPFGISITGFSIDLFVVDDKGKEALVISFPSKLILYHLHDMSITQLTVSSEMFVSLPVYLRYDNNAATSLRRHSTCKHIETLAYV